MLRWLKKLRQSLILKVACGSLLNILCVTGIIGVTIFSFQHIAPLLVGIVEKDVATVVENARLGRELSMVFADTNRLLSTFIDNQEFLETERNRLTSILEETLMSSGAFQHHEKLGRTLHLFTGQLRILFHRCAAINEISTNLHIIGKTIDADLEALEATLTEQMLALKIGGETQQAYAMSQLRTMLPGYRQTLLQVIVRLTEARQIYLLPDAVEAYDEQRILTLQNDLQRAFHAIMSTVQGFSVQEELLLGYVQQYKDVTRAFFRAAEDFRVQLDRLHTIQSQVLTEMEVLDTQTVQAAGHIQQEIINVIQESNTLIVALSAIVVVVMLLGVYYVVRTVAPVKQLAGVATQLATGDIQCNIPETRAYDEIGTLTRAFKHLIDATCQTARLAEEVANGNLSVNVKERSEHDRLMQALNTMTKNLTERTAKIARQHAEITRQKYILDTFMATVPDLICFKDYEGCIIQANQSHALRMGFDNPWEEIGKTDFDFFPEKDADIRSAQEQKILDTGEPLINQEESARWPDGRVHWSLTTTMPLLNEHDDIIGTFGISRDITPLKEAEQELQHYRERLEELVEERTTELSQTVTEAQELNERLRAEAQERRRIEAALRMNEQQYRVLAESVMAGILILQGGKLVFTNHNFATMSGHAPETLLMSRPEKLFDLPHNQTLDGWLTTQRGPEQPCRSQLQLRTKSDSALWTEIEHTPMTWNGQQGMLLTIYNITERKLREQHLEEERLRLQHENVNLKTTISERYRFGALVGKSPVMQRVYELIISAAASGVNVLLCGESGTGKELIAQTLHQAGPRKDGPFIPVNCASIPETLFEREFFGHKKGAFTSADRSRPGFFDRAHGGILFLDEVTELTPGMQAKLLRVLQDGQYTPLGATAPKHADVVILAATNKDCKEEIANKRLRKDFYYRIGVVEIPVPSLQTRKEDLPLLIEHILEQYRQKQENIHGHGHAELPKDQTELPAEFVQALYACDWPGNVRELQNVLQRYVVTRDLRAVMPLLGDSGDSSNPVANIMMQSYNLSLSEAVETLEKQMIAAALEDTGFRVVKTAEKLGMSRRTLHNKIKKYDFALHVRSS